MKVDKDKAYFLHSKPFRENSAIVKLLTQSHGLVDFLVSGIKPRKSKLTSVSKSALLQPGQPLLIDYQLKDNLSKLILIESAERKPALGSEYFMLYQYVHELLLSLLPLRLPLPTIFQAYEECLSLFREAQPNYALRKIEIALIEHFNGIPQLQKALDSEFDIEKDKYYFYKLEYGLYENQPNHYEIRFQGQQLLAFSHLCQSHLGDDKEINDALAKGAQSVSTFFIAQLLNGKTLKTRNIYRDLQSFK